MIRPQPRWLSLALALAVGLTACDDGETPARELDQGPGDAQVSTPDAGPDATPDAALEPPCGAQQLWALDGEELHLWPDPRLLVDDPEGPTGYRLDPDPERVPWLGVVPTLAADTMPDLAKLSGYGRTGAVLFRFSEPVEGVPTGAEATLAEDAAAVIFDLSTEPPTRVAFQLERGEDGATVILVPNHPLRPGAVHAAVLGPRITTTEGACVDAAAGVAAMLEGRPPEGVPAALAEALPRAVAAMGWSDGEVAAATVFVTADDSAPIVEAAQGLSGRSYAWAEAPACEIQGDTRRCEGAFDAFDFRDDKAIFTAEPQPERWRLPVSIWLPAEGEGPFPTLVYGHGIASRRQGAGGVARVVVPRGYAVVSVDALRHGDHPTGGEGESAAALAFLGVDLTGPRVDAMALRGNFNQTALDRLQVVQLLRQAPDMDGDGAPEFDAARIGYWGISLGGLYGVATLALGEDLGAGVLSVAGGRLMAFVTETEQIAAFRPLLANLVGGPDALQRYLVVLQTLVDAGDPALWATHVLADRFGGEPPHVLLPVCLEDGTVPPLTGRTLARAMGLPHVAPVLHPVDGAEVLEAPVRANINGRTAGYFQFDRVGDPPRAATHNNTPTSPQGALQAATFLDGWLDGDAVIIDPYAELETPPLP